MSKIKIISIALAVLVLTPFLLFGSFEDTNTSTEKTPGVVQQNINVAPPETQLLYEVTRVIDGDTIEVNYNGSTKIIRYIGINTPETVHPSKPVECFGKEASDKNKELLLGKKVRLEKDISETDSYGRLLRYVFVDDIFINELLVKEGFASASTYPPDVAHSKSFNALEKNARDQKIGLWSSACTKEVAAATSTTKETKTEPITPTSCTIKGNISSSNEKIYHMVGCRSYNQTKIDETKGEEWFCSEQEARDAGWRKALNC